MENQGKKPTIIYVDGVFDIIHSGHFNAIRQAKKLGDILYVGVNGDESVTKAKGPPLTNNDERAYLVGACKFVDKVIPDTDYTPSIQLLDSVGADFAAHGDDMAVNDLGVDCYAEIKNADRMKVFKRTDGVSTTDLIGRLLQIGLNTESQTVSETIYKPLQSKYLSTGWRFKEFCNDKVPHPSEKVIYIDGVWDVLHEGYIHALEIAKSMGDFLYVGVYDDDTCKTLYGSNYPVLSLQERTTNLLALKYVDDVVIACPKVINQEMIISLNISTVLVEETTVDLEKDNRYDYPKKIEILKKIKSKYPLNNDFLVNRIMERKEEFKAKYLKKSIKEEEYYKKRKLSDLIEI